MDIQFGFQSFSSGSIPPSPTPPDPIPLTYANVGTVNKLLYLPAYNNGPLDDGVGATLVATQDGYISDGTTFGKIDYNYIAQVGDIILVKNEVSKLRNGLYQVVDTGSSTTPYQLVRSPENDTSSELYPLQVNVLFGQTQNLRFYIQTTVNPTIGTSNIVFSLSVSSSYTTPLTFVDTATSSALPDCNYASGASTSFPGLGATLTATNVGALGTINGLTATTNQNLTTGFYKILVKNQANEAHNGTYLVTTAGNATTRWKLTRIDYTYGSFQRYVRYFLVSNTGSTLAGKYYFTVPTNPPLTNATIGTANLQILEYGGGAGGYNLIQEEGTSLPARTTIDFQGGGVTATDDGTKTIVTIPGGGSSIVGENYVVVYAGDDWLRNGTELQNAYALAQTLTPNGSPIGAGNRVTVVCYPGYYDFTRVLDVTDDFIDIVSITGNCDVRLISADAPLGIKITAPNDVFIKGIDTAWASQTFFIGVDTTPTHIFENCKGGDYSFGYYDELTAPFDNRYDMGGTFIDCVGGHNSFGSNYNASGIFTNCVAGTHSFGASIPLSGYNTSTTGTFTNCVANENSFGVNGTCTGRFINCTANDKSFGYTCTEVTGAYFENCKGGDDCFVSSEIPNITVINITGDVINCTANDRSFGYGYETANCNLNFDHCTGNDYCFVVNMDGSASAIKTTINCTARDYSFGYGSVTGGVKHNFDRCIGRNYCFSGTNTTGKHTNCIAEANSFENAIDGQSNGNFYNCKAGSYSFGSLISSGLYNNCSADTHSFGGATGVCSGTYRYCTANVNSFASDITGTLSGKLYWCEMAGTTFNTVSGSGKTFYCVGNDIPNNQ
jgi:hypothetical protein